MIDVILIAPVRAYREALATAFAAAPGFKLVGQATTGSEAVAGVARRQPSVALLDFGITDLIPVLGAMQRTAPATRLVAMGIDSGPRHAEAVVRAAEAGISGFVDCDQPLTAVLESVRLAVRGQSSCSPRIAALLLQAMQRRPSPPAMPLGLRTHLDAQIVLTPRESVVAELAARGLTNRQIAAQLMVGESTVKTHMHATLRKLGLQSRAELRPTSQRTAP